MAAVTVVRRFRDYTRGRRVDLIKLNIAATGDTLVTGFKQIDQIVISLPTSSPDGGSGIATLVGGTVTVADARVKTGARILITRNTVGGTLGNLSVPAASITDATSFVINSDQGTETSTINYLIINPGGDVLGYTLSTTSNITTITFLTDGAVTGALVEIIGI